MKTLYMLIVAVGIAAPLSIYAAKAGAQVGAEQERAQGGAQYGVENEISGDGVQNATQDEPYGAYGAGESPNTLSGDGIPNRTQDEEYGEYRGAGAAVGSGTPAVPLRAREAQDAGSLMGAQYRVQSSGELSQATEQIRERVRAEQEESDGESGEVRRERERAEVALQTMAAAGPLFGEAQEQVQERARTLQGLYDEALGAETKIRERGGFTRFFAGGDDDAAAALLDSAERARAQVRVLEGMVDQCVSCDDAARTTLREQLRSIEAEQDRVEAVATAEQSWKGVVGFLFGWLGL